MGASRGAAQWPYSDSENLKKERELFDPHSLYNHQHHQHLVVQKRSLHADTAAQKSSQVCVGESDFDCGLLCWPSTPWWYATVVAHLAAMHLLPRSAGYALPGSGDVLRAESGQRPVASTAGDPVLDDKGTAAGPAMVRWRSTIQVWVNSMQTNHRCRVFRTTGPSSSPAEVGPPVCQCLHAALTVLTRSYQRNQTRHMRHLHDPLLLRVRPIRWRCKQRL